MLGGLNDQYRSMYDKIINTTKEYLLYKPLVEDKYDLLFTGAYTPLVLDETTGRYNGWFESESGHLSCFVGGMYALGSKVFDRPEDLETAKKLTDGCVWQYSSMITGIGPEGMSPAVCKDINNCEWNETEWRHQVAEEHAKSNHWFELRLQRALNPDLESDASSITFPVAVDNPEFGTWGAHTKRQVDGAVEAAKDTVSNAADNLLAKIAEPLAGDAQALVKPKTNSQQGTPTKPEDAPAAKTAAGSPTPTKPRETWDQIMDEYIREEKLPPGALSIKDRRYILRSVPSHPSLHSPSPFLHPHH